MGKQIDKDITYPTKSLMSLFEIFTDPPSIHCREAIPILLSMLRRNARYSKFGEKGAQTPTTPRNTTSGFPEPSIDNSPKSRSARSRHKSSPKPILPCNSLSSFSARASYNVF